MVSGKTFFSALLFSLSIHAAIGLSAWAPSFFKAQSGGASPAPSEYAQYQIAAPEPSASKAEVSPEKKPPQEMSAPAQKATASAKTAGEPHKLPMFFTKAGSGNPVPVPKIAPPKEASDFLMDPQKSRIFIDYFGRVKQRINQEVKSRYPSEEGAQGVVSLVFILNANGELKKVVVVEKETSARSELKALAVEALRRSAPFAVFPKNLNAPEIAFNLKIYFDKA